MAENSALKAKAERIAAHARIMAESQGFTVPSQQDLWNAVITWLAIRDAAAMDDAVSNNFIRKEN